VLRKTRASCTKALAPEDDGTRRDPRVDPFSSMRPFGAARQWQRRAERRSRAS
jgi:hypothetical protein